VIEHLVQLQVGSVVFPSYQLDSRVFHVVCWSKTMWTQTVFIRNVVMVLYTRVTRLLDHV